MIEAKCDSCEREVDILVPIRILCETRNGMEMQLKHYCPKCFWDITEGWGSRGDESEKDVGWIVAWKERFLGKGFKIKKSEDLADRFFNVLDKDINIEKIIKGKIYCIKEKGGNAT